MPSLNYFSSFLLLAGCALSSFHRHTVVAQPPGIEATISSTAANYVLQQFIPIIEVSIHGIDSIRIYDRSYGYMMVNHATVYFQKGKGQLNY